MSLTIGGQSSGLRSLAQWVILGALAAAVINSSDIKRYFELRNM
ncbi:MAG TPA: hypothetical protein VMU20_21790 [Candidatus Dormibacteraeota bacterium]|jgi:hypothetical protein|nr:hypothetical protein [Candidatus Dormibacteraeota bacterium]